MHLCFNFDIRFYLQHCFVLNLETKFLFGRLNGPDPLDYISMFLHNGNPRHGIPPHWHYVSCGLSDLHGDGRVHGRTEGR